MQHYMAAERYRVADRPERGTVRRALRILGWQASLVSCILSRRKTLVRLSLNKPEPGVALADPPAVRCVPPGPPRRPFAGHHEREVWGEGTATQRRGRVAPVGEFPYSSLFFSGCLSPDGTSASCMPPSSGPLDAVQGRSCVRYQGAPPQCDVSLADSLR